MVLRGPEHAKSEREEHASYRKAK